MQKDNNTIKPNFYERICCPVCENKKIKLKAKFIINEKAFKSFTKIYSGNKIKRNLKCFSNTKINICYCHNCQLIYHKLIPDEITLEYIYTVLINKKESLTKYKSRESFNKNKSLKLLKRLKAIINAKSLKNINYLDFGFGWGSLLLSSRSL